MTPLIANSMTRTRGFTLVETLVALVVLSIGLLGIASLQLSSLRWNHGASMRSQATLLAYDIVDRMRANQVAAIDMHEYDVGLAATKSSGTVAGDDIIRWKANLAATLPNGDGSVAREVTGTTTTFVVTVQWDDSHSEATAANPAPAPMSFVLRTQL